jgi:hypothetical protein
LESYYYKLKMANTDLTGHSPEPMYQVHVGVPKKHVGRLQIWQKKTTKRLRNSAEDKLNIQTTLKFINAGVAPFGKGVVIQGPESQVKEIMDSLPRNLGRIKFNNIPIKPVEEESEIPAETALYTPTEPITVEDNPLDSTSNVEDYSSETSVEEPVPVVPYEPADTSLLNNECGVEADYNPSLLQKAEADKQIGNASLEDSIELRHNASEQETEFSDIDALNILYSIREEVASTSGRSSARKREIVEKAFRDAGFETDNLNLDLQNLRDNGYMRSNGYSLNPEGLSFIIEHGRSQADSELEELLEERLAADKKRTPIEHFAEFAKETNERAYSALEDVLHRISDITIDAIKLSKPEYIGFLKECRESGISQKQLFLKLFESYDSDLFDQVKDDIGSDTELDEYINNLEKSNTESEFSEEDRRLVEQYKALPPEADTLIDGMRTDYEDAVARRELNSEYNERSELISSLSKARASIKHVVGTVTIDVCGIFNDIDDKIELEFVYLDESVYPEFDKERFEEAYKTAEALGLKYTLTSLTHETEI